MANLELGVPITPRTVFDIASIDKMFTATAVLLLAQEGKVSLDAPIRRYFPEMPPYASSITGRQLFYHVSGLREVSALAALAGNSEPVDSLDFLHVISRSAETNFPPGTRADYSNTGYALAEQLVYRVSGRNLAAFLRERVFDPLGMTDTRMLDDYREVLAGRAQAYSPSGTAFRIDMHHGYTTNGGLQTTVEDFARWDRNWTEATVGGRALVEALVVPGRLRDGSSIDYALGVSASTYRGLRTVAKGGWGGGFLTAYVRFPDQRLSVACFCNAGPSVDAEDLAKEVATVYLGAQMTPDTVGIAWTTALLAVPAVAVPVEELRRLAGLWRQQGDFPYAPRGFVLRLRVEGARLVDQFGRRLESLGGNRFRLHAGELVGELVFDREGTGTPQRIRNRVKGSTTTFERVGTARVTAAQLAEYAGEYRSEEIETTYTLAVDTVGVALWIGSRRLGTLEPTGRDAFVLVRTKEGLEPGAYSFEFTRGERGRVAGFLIQGREGLGLRNLQAVRRR